MVGQSKIKKGPVLACLGRKGLTLWALAFFNKSNNLALDRVT